MLPERRAAERLGTVGMARPSVNSAVPLKIFNKSALNPINTEIISYIFSSD
jgi:hypothetical protein